MRSRSKRLTNEDKTLITTLADQGMKFVDIAIKLDCTQSTISRTLKYHWEPLICSVCGGPVQRKAKYGICKRTPSCRTATKNMWINQSPENKRKHRTTNNASKEKWRQANPMADRLDKIKIRARKASVPFALTMENTPPIPEYCPVLGLKLERPKKGIQPNSPSLDRIIPELGYVPDNVQWMSYKANMMKSNATPEQLQAFARWVDETYGKG